MAKSAQELYDYLKEMGGPGAAVMPGLVQAVNSDDTIDVEVDGLVYYDVRIQSAVKTQKGIKPIPATGSVVVIERIGDERSKEYQVVLYSELDEYSIEIDTVKLLLDNNGFLLQKGTDSLKKVLSDLIDQILKIYAPMDKPAIAQIKLRANQLLQ